MHTKSFLLAALALAALMAITSAAETFTVHGRVYCDTCQCGFETNVTTYIPEAKVRIQCLGRDDLSVEYKVDGVTDEQGRYAIKVDKDHGDDICEAKLLSSPWTHCNIPDPGRSKSSVVVTNNNGVASPDRHANNLGFRMDHTLAVCDQLVNYYLHSYE